MVELQEENNELRE
jgi:hypothetical protein